MRLICGVEAGLEMFKYFFYFHYSAVPLITGQLSAVEKSLLLAFPQPVDTVAESSKRLLFKRTNVLANSSAAFAHFHSHYYYY